MYITQLLSYLLEQTRDLVVGLWESTPFYLRVTNIITYFWYYITDNVDFLDPNVAKAISFYCAGLLSVGTLFIAILKFKQKQKEGK